MSKNPFKNAKFVKTAVKKEDYPVLRSDSGDFLPEIAVAGRSNVGKSSLLNNLFQAKGLVKTSSFPGKTQALNFFNVDNKWTFVDLPGYGYAQVPLTLKKNWGPMVQTYLQNRDQLKIILFLFDIRRIPNDEDRMLVDWIAQNEKAMILVLTKVDKVTANERESNRRKILEELRAGNLHYTYYSSTKNIGHKELTAMIFDALSENSSQDSII